MKIVIIRGGEDETEIIFGQKTQIDSSLLNESDTKSSHIPSTLQQAFTLGYRQVRSIEPFHMHNLQSPIGLQIGS